LCCCACKSAESDYEQIKSEVDRGDFDSTLGKTNAALNRYGRHNAEWQWRFLVLKARILVWRSQYTEALALLGSDVPSGLANTEIPEQAKLYQGIAHRGTGEFAQAERDFADADRLSERLPPFYVCELLIRRADLSVDEKKYRRAEDDYQKAFSLSREHALTAQEATALTNWGRAATHEGHFDQALDLYQSALQVLNSLQKRANVGTMATVLGNLGWNYGELGDFEASLDFYKRGADTSAKSGMLGYTQYWLSGVATASVALHEYAAGEDVAQTTLQRAIELKHVPTRVACLYALAEIKLRTGRLKEAEHDVQEALALETGDENQKPFSDTLALSGEIAAAQSRFSEAEALFQQVLADSNTAPNWRWEAEAGMAEVADGEGKFADAEHHFLSAITIIEKSRESINHEEPRLSFLTSGIRVYDQYIDFLVRRGRSSDALMQAELSRARTLQDGLSSDTHIEKVALHDFRPESIARRCKAALFFYWLGEKQSHLWVILPGKTTHLALPPEGQIDPLVKAYRQALVQGTDALETGNADGQKLYTMLVEPAMRLIAKNSRVIVLPDGSLYGLNFETLIVRNPKPHYWIEDATLTTASSLTLLASAANRAAPKEKSLFMVGDAVPPSADYPALPQAAAEMQGVEKYFPAAERMVLSGGQATPDAYLRSQPEQFAYLHFVTHGTASRARPLESAVVLSKEKDEDAFKLYARDIVNHKLSAYLVTISACNGAGTRAYSGEGLVGLSWAFLRAGAHNVIGALWEVSESSSTPQLMDKLYDGLSHGEDPASALRAAKLSLLHSDGVYKKPFYWAPFQLYAGS
jgi:CHAT domain-containing protein/Tfp pilus assembly protein PilF